MRDFFLSECRRFRNAALIFAAVHLLLQLFINRMTDILQVRRELHMLILGVYMTAGMAFALVQFGSYRQPGRWLWLLHRPLARGAVFGSVALASALLIVVAVGVPALLTVASIDTLSARTVDGRHYAMVLELVLLTIIAWLVGSYVMINGRRSAIVVVLLPYLMLAQMASVYVRLLPAVLCLALLAFIAYSTFKPDRAAPPSGMALVATAAPLQLDPDEGHNPRKPMFRAAYSHLLQRLLHEHLGGPAVPAATPELANYLAQTLQVNTALK
ncbi:MAG: hypothetical protein V4631_02320 [Pseudomonadota bacterium]